MTREIWTIGHSTREMEDFVGALAGPRIEVLADVRRLPHSRRNPWFNSDALKRSLFRQGIRYEFLGDELGGFRKPGPDSPHVALGGSMFQGYADHLSTSVFARGVQILAALAGKHRVAYMCSERMPKDCHRKILSDHLLIEGWTIHHILDAGDLFDHELTPTARVVDGRLLYAPKPLDEFSAREPA